MAKQSLFYRPARALFAYAAFVIAFRHIVVSGWRMYSERPRTQWLADRPDWFIKYLCAYTSSINARDGDIRLMINQALLELDFRRQFGGCK